MPFIVHGGIRAAQLVLFCVQLPAMLACKEALAPKSTNQNRQKAAPQAQ